MRLVAVLPQGRLFCRYLRHHTNTVRSFHIQSVLRVVKDLKPRRRQLPTMSTNEVVKKVVERSDNLSECTNNPPLPGKQIEKSGSESEIHLEGASARVQGGETALVQGDETANTSGVLADAQHAVKTDKKRRRRRTKSKEKSLGEEKERNQPFVYAEDPKPLSSSTPTKPKHNRNHRRNRHGQNENESSDVSGNGRKVQHPASKQRYEEYWNKEYVYKALKNKSVLAGVLRISPLNYQNSWLSVPGLKCDVFIKGRLQQNRAMNGDIVAVKVNEKSQWTVLHNKLDYHEDKFGNSIIGGNESLVDDVTDMVEDLSLNDNASVSRGEVQEKSEGLFVKQDQSDAIDSELKDTQEDLSQSDDHSMTTDTDVKDDNTLSRSVNQAPEDNGEVNSADKTPNRNRNRKPEDIPEEFLQQTGRVICILEKKHSRVAAGYLKPFRKTSHNKSALFSPTDGRLPRLRIQHEFCPEGFFNRPQDFEKTLLVAKITDWTRESPSDSYLADGYIAKSLGNTGEIEPETEAILLQYGIDTGPFPDKALACLPTKKPWTIPKKEYDSRRDFRKECVFTIDPATARDLDDALHCNRLADGTYEVGVHIADVSFFVREGTALDEVALDRGTSTYMVQKVIPMLPRLLCEELCSLNPDLERLTFSVVWKIAPNGEILDEWMGRGIIKSCVKMAYEHAQDIIMHPDREWKTEELPPISKAFCTSRIVEGVLDLHKIAQRLKDKRYQNGALRINLPKLQFTLDQDSGMPNGYHAYKQQESNQLVEEFMLLANMAVAVQIYTGNPDTALLRCHPNPGQRQLDDLVQLCEDLGLEFKVDSSKHIQESLAQFPKNAPENMILSQYAMKSMKNALYFCTGVVKDEEDFLHYALSVPFYTHFTSPIRRYPDIIVHRQLASCLDIDKLSKRDKDAIAVISSQCNDKKLAAKKAGEMSNDLYFAVFLNESGPLEGDGMVMSIMDHACDVIIPEFGIVKRCYLNQDKQVKDFKFSKCGHLSPPELVITWEIKENENDDQGVMVQQILNIFTQVTVVLSTAQTQEGDKSLKVSANLLPPKTVDGKIKCE